MPKGKRETGFMVALMDAFFCRSIVNIGSDWPTLDNLGAIDIHFMFHILDFKGMLSTMSYVVAFLENSVYYGPLFTIRSTSSCDTRAKLHCNVFPRKR